MRIAINTRILLSSRMEGVARFTYEVIRRIITDHPEDTFILIFDRPFDPIFVQGDNVIPVVIGPPTRHPLLWYCWFEYRIPVVLNKYKADVFLSPDTYGSLRTKVPTILVSHDIAYKHYPEHIPWLTRKYYQYYFPKFHQTAHHIIAVSKATKKDIIESYGISKDRITVAYNGQREGFYPLSDEEKAKMRDKYSGGKPYFIYVGSIHPRKNISNLVKAYDEYRSISSKDYKLLLAGRWAWNTGQISQTIQNSTYRNDIIILPRVDDGIPKLIGAAHCLMYVSLLEGFGIPIVEAMQCEVPVITSDRSSMPEVAGDAALLANPEDPQEIARLMLRLDSDIDLRHSLVEKAKQNIDRFSWEETSRRVYEAILSVSYSDMD